MLLFESEEFALVIDSSHGRKTSRTNGVRSSVKIRTISEFGELRHSKLLRTEAAEPLMASAFNYAAAISEALGLFAKHVLHRTGLPCVGLNGTVVSLPHCEQVTCVSIRRRPVLPCFLALHCLQCFGTFVNPFSWKNCCSPAENTNVAPQLTHKTSLSANMLHSSELAN